MSDNGKRPVTDPETLIAALATGEISDGQIEALLSLLAEDTPASRELACRVQDTRIIGGWLEAECNTHFAKETADLISRLWRDSCRAFVVDTMRLVSAEAQSREQATKRTRTGKSSRRASRHLRPATRRVRVFPYVVMAVASAACVLVAFQMGFFKPSATDSVAKNGQPEPVNPWPPAEVAKKGQPKPVELESSELEVVAATGARRSDGQPLKPGDHACAGDVIATGPAGSVTLRYADETSLELRAGGELAVLPGEAPVGAKERSKGIELRAGGLAVKVAPQPKGQPFAIRTPQATTTVVGTQFSLQVRDSRTCLQVTEGTVQFERGHESLLVEKDTIAVADERRPGLLVFRLAGNLALKKPATASAMKRYFSASWAVDGKLTSAWNGSPAPQWLLVDLGELCKIAAIQIFPLTTRPSDHRYYQYRIELSKDGNEWHEVVDQSANTTPSTPEGDLYLLPQVEEARLVRVTMLTNSVSLNVHVAELCVFPPQEGEAEPVRPPTSP